MYVCTLRRWAFFGVTGNKAKWKHSLTELQSTVAHDIYTAGLSRFYVCRQLALREFKAFKTRFRRSHFNDWNFILKTLRPDKKITSLASLPHFRNVPDFYFWILIKELWHKLTTLSQWMTCIFTVTTAIRRAHSYLVRRSLPKSGLYCK